MADINKAALRNRVLEHLSVIAAGETPATADQTFVEEMIDAAWEELRKLGLMPFATSAIPSWAQIGLRDWVAAACGPTYGKPWTADDVERMKGIAERHLQRQVAGYRHSTQIEVESF